MTGRHPQTTLHIGDCVEVMRTMDADSVSAIVTDPPAGIAFMGRDWDSNKGGRDEWVSWLAGVMREALRVAKPGAHALVWSLPRTSGWTHRALEDAGWIVRDCISHLFGSGFPKSANLGDGRGTALKPAAEFWYLARKPFPGTVAANVATYGTGGLNIDACRIVSSANDPNVRDRSTHTYHDTVGYSGGFGTERATPAPYQLGGRWPANLIIGCCGNDPHDEGCAVRLLDEQSGERPSRPGRTTSSSRSSEYGLSDKHKPPASYVSSDDTGGCSRFFKHVTPDTEATRFTDTEESYCWLCDSTKHGIMSANPYDNGGAKCNENSTLNNVNTVELLFNHQGDALDFVRIPAQDQQPLDFADSNPSNSKPVHNAERISGTTQVTEAPIAPCDAWDSQLEQFVHRVKFAGNLCDSCATVIAQSLARAKHKTIPQLLPGLDSITDFKNFILTHSLASFVEPWASTGTIPTIASLSILFGYVRHVIEENTKAESYERTIASAPTRFRYQSKASRSERNAGLDGMPERGGGAYANGAGMPGRTLVDGVWVQTGTWSEPNRQARANHHPTVKPLSLMSYLLKLIVPPGGTVLDPFAGSGSTGCAAAMLDMTFIGIEMDPEYAAIAMKRIAHATPPLFRTAAD